MNLQSRKPQLGFLIVFQKWAHLDSNQRPLHYQCSGLNEREIVLFEREIAFRMSLFSVM